MKKLLCFLMAAVFSVTLASCDFDSMSDDETAEAMDDMFRQMVDSGDYERYAKGYSVDPSSYKYLETDLDQNGWQDYLLCASAAKPGDPDGEYMMFLPVFIEENQLYTAFSKVIDCGRDVFKLICDENLCCYLLFSREEPDDYAASVYYMEDNAARLAESIAHTTDETGEERYYYSDNADLFDSDDGIYGDNFLSDEETFQLTYDTYIAYSEEAALENGILNGFADFYENGYYEESNDEFVEEGQEIFLEENDDPSDDIPAVESTTRKATSTAPDKASNELTPTKAEMEDLAMMANNWSDFDCSGGVVTEDILSQTIDIFGMYGDWGCSEFGDVYVVDDGDPDPRAVLYSDMGYGYSYYVYPGDQVDFFLREILNVEPDHSIEVYSDMDGSLLGYYENGYYYYTRYMAGDEDESFYVSHTTLPDGKVAVKLKVCDYGDDRPQEVKIVTAKIKLIDGQRVWSIYKVEIVQSNY